MSKQTAELRKKSRDADVFREEVTPDVRLSRLRLELELERYRARRWADCGVPATVDGIRFQSYSSREAVTHITK